MIIILLLFIHILGFLSAIHAVMTVRTSQGAIAWAISLATFPYIALPTYWLLGRSKFQGYTTAKQSSDLKVQAQLVSLQQKLIPYRATNLNNTERAIENLVTLPYLVANEIDLLVDGKATFASILSGITSAKDYILFQFFIVHDDEIGEEIKNALIARAKQGIKIYFLYDEIGCHDLPEHYKNQLRAAGIAVYDFHTQKGIRNRFQVNFRNHRKIIVVDGETAWLGGLNIGDEYLGRNTKFGHWRDTHMKISGPSVIPIQISFVQDWYWATESHLQKLQWQPKVADEFDKNLTRKVLIVPSGPADSLETTGLLFVQVINDAKERLWITSPYFIPDQSIVKALQLAALRGVDVRILIPDIADHIAVYLAAFTYFDETCQTGVRIYRYKQGFLHQKVMLIDQQHASIGTANLDNRSFRLNFEITAMVSDVDFNQQVEAMLLEDLSHAILVPKDELSSKSFLFKLATRVARLTAPIL
ncbi:MAG: cardiolipin synthase [Colwellia sp.]|nr:cardiolipin synthase [Colwellia sp.]